MLITIWRIEYHYVSLIVSIVNELVSFHIYIYIYMYGCHLLLDVCIIYFISCDCILSNILKIAELDCCQIIILSIYVPSTHANTHVLRLSLDLPYETR
jgi:hypothetical protein